MALGDLGGIITKGGRMYHLLSKKSDKGTAVLRIADYYRRISPDPIVTVGIGDSENDIPMLMVVDRPFIVRKKNGTALQTGLTSVIETEGSGPAGFSEAVKGVLGA
jgi:mannosyl-3-phosphoglycerate phosphatase